MKTVFSISAWRSGLSLMGVRFNDKGYSSTSRFCLKKHMLHKTTKSFDSHQTSPYLQEPYCEGPRLLSLTQVTSTHDGYLNTWERTQPYHERLSNMSIRWLKLFSRNTSISWAWGCRSFSGTILSEMTVIFSIGAEKLKTVISNQKIRGSMHHSRNEFIGKGYPPKRHHNPMYLGLISTHPPGPLSTFMVGWAT